MSKMTNTALGLITLFSSNLMTACNQPATKANVIGATYQTNKAQSVNRKVCDMLILDIDTAHDKNTSPQIIKDTLLVIRQNAYDEMESQTLPSIATCHYLEKDTVPPHIFLNNKLYQFKNVKDYTNLQDTMETKHAFYGHSHNKRFMVELKRN